MPINEALAGKILATVGAAIKFAAAAAERKKAPHHWKLRIDTTLHEKAFLAHAAVVMSWSSEVQLDTARRALMDILISPEVYEGGARNRGEKQTLTTPIELLGRGKGFVLLGGPGAGKTTSLKMIARHIQTGEPITDSDTFDLPILVRIRDLRPGDSLVNHILNLMGVSFGYESMASKREDELLWMLDKNSEESRFLAASKTAFLLEFINSSDCLLLMDGLDEAHADSIPELAAELNSIVAKSDRACCVLTCRHGAYSFPVNGLDAYSMQRFSQDQIKLFATKWFDHEATALDFIVRLKNTPYHQMAEIPLHAANLCMVYEQHGDLPNEHYKMYEKILDIRIRQWDLLRGVRRIGKHYGFDQSEKRKLLAHTAFELAKRGRGVSFSVLDFSHAIEEVGPRFRLEITNSRELLDELEAHTGVIFLSGFETYDFIHKAIQEYLCGEHLAKLPIISTKCDFLMNMPDACAMATVLSHGRELFVFQIWDAMIKERSKYFDGRQLKGLASYLIQYWARLASEGCDFCPHRILAIGLLAPLARLIQRWELVDERLGAQLAEAFVSVCALKGVRESILEVDSKGTRAVGHESLWGIRDWTKLRFGKRVGWADSIGRFEYPSELLVPSHVLTTT